MKFFLVVLITLTASVSSFAQRNNLIPFVKNYAQQHNFNGTVLIQKNSKTIYNGSFGLANREFSAAFTNDTKFKICSITKAFTAVLILQLYERGKIDLNQTISAYLPDYSGEGADKVSICQLLNHTSGLANTDTVKSVDNALKYGVDFYNKPYTLDQIVQDFCSGPLANRPGEKFDYNNGDYLILGKILETIYHKSYETILNEQILNQLNMNQSGLLSQDMMVERLADTYFLRTDINQIVPDLPVYHQDWYSAGAMYSTAPDVLKFFSGLFSYKLIRKESLEAMLTPGMDDYGYGVWIRDYKGANTKYKRMERYGSILGANSVVFKYLNEDLTIVILSNTNLTNLGDFALNLGKIVF